MIAPILSQLFDPTAFGIVAGGTALAVLLRNPFVDVRAGLAALGTLGRGRFTADPLVAQIATLDRIALRQGVHALDRSLIADPDMRAAVAAIVDGGRADQVAELLADLRRARTERHVRIAELWAGAAEAAPAMGMVGTLVGLAAMFATMTDPSAIGSAMAVALLATLYGALVANLVAAPIAARLRLAGRAEAFERVRIEAPLVALAAREMPRTPLQSVA